MLRFCDCLRALLRMRRWADLVFGITQIRLIILERVTVAEPGQLSIVKEPKEPKAWLAWLLKRGAVFGH